MVLSGCQESNLTGGVSLSVGSGLRSLCAGAPLNLRSVRSQLPLVMLAQAGIQPSEDCVAPVFPGMTTSLALLPRTPTEIDTAQCDPLSAMRWLYLSKRKCYRGNDAAPVAFSLEFTRDQCYELRLRNTSWMIPSAASGNGGTSCSAKIILARCLARAAMSWQPLATQLS